MKKMIEWYLYIITAVSLIILIVYEIITHQTQWVLVVFLSITVLILFTVET
jgi:hypothetical protein